MLPPDPITVTTLADVTHLDVRTLPERALVSTLIWDRAGERRVVPASIRSNAFRVYEAGRTLVASGTLPDIPDEWCQIPWHSCRELITLRPIDVQLLTPDAIAAIRH